MIQLEPVCSLTKAASWGSVFSCEELSHRHFCYEAMVYLLEPAIVYFH